MTDTAKTKHGWWRRFAVGVAVLAPAMAVISVVLWLLGYESRSLQEVVVGGAFYCLSFSAIYASAERWRDKSRDGS